MYYTYSIISIMPIIPTIVPTIIPTYHYIYQMWTNVAEGPRGCLAKHSALARPLGSAQPQSRGDAHKHYAIPTINIASTIIRVVPTLYLQLYYTCYCTFQLFHYTYYYSYHTYYYVYYCT